MQLRTCVLALVGGTCPNVLNYINDIFGGLPDVNLVQVGFNDIGTLQSSPSHGIMLMQSIKLGNNHYMGSYLKTNAGY